MLPQHYTPGWAGLAQVWLLVLSYHQQCGKQDCFDCLGSYNIEYTSPGSPPFNCWLTKRGKWASKGRVRWGLELETIRCLPALDTLTQPGHTEWSSCRWGKMHNTGNLTVGLWQSPGYCDPQPGVIMSSCAPDSWYWGTAPHQLELTGVGSRSSSSCPYIITPPQSSQSQSFMHSVSIPTKGSLWRLSHQPTQHSTKCCNQLTLLPWNLHCIMSSSD